MKKSPFDLTKAKVVPPPKVEEDIALMVREKLIEKLRKQEKQGVAERVSSTPLQRILNNLVYEYLLSSKLSKASTAFFMEASFCKNPDELELPGKIGAQEIFEILGQSFDGEEMSPDSKCQTFLEKFLINRSMDFIFLLFLIRWNIVGMY